MRALGCLLLLAGGVAAGPARHYMTDFGRRVLARTDQIVEAEVTRIQPAFRGITTAHLKVLRHVSGFDRKPTLVLMYVDDLTAPDAFGSTLQRSSVSYERRRRSGLKNAAQDELTGGKDVSRSTESGGKVAAGRAGVRLAKGETALFFLVRKGISYSLIGLVPKADSLYERKYTRLKEILRLEAVAALDFRATQVKRFFLAGLRNTNPWERGNSAREILSLATRFPKVFSKDEAKQVTRQLLRETELPIRAALERAVRSIDPARNSATASVSRHSSSPNGNASTNSRHR